MVKVRSRVFQIVQYERNPLTGEDLGFNEKTILEGLEEKTRALKNWAYVRHDKDPYVEGDDIPDGKQLGDPRPPHWHVVLQFTNQAELPSVARAFKVPEQYVDKMTGASAFFDGVYYLTHEDDKQRIKGKHTYDRSEVKLPDTSDTGTWFQVDKLVERRLKKLPATLEAERYVSKLSEGEMTLAQVYDEDPTMYAKNYTTFKTARQAFLRHAKPPIVRTNYYMSGEAGSGKTIAAKALARSLFPDREDAEIFFVVGDGAVPFEGYDGQPVIIWDDWRAKDILGKFDRGSVWKLFAINPDKIAVNVKYGAVNLVNSISIVTSVVPFKEFMEELAGEYTDSKRVKHPAEDSNQGYRRFPVFLEITRESYQLFASQALTGGEFSEYQRLAQVNVNLIELAKNPMQQNLEMAFRTTKKIGQAVQQRYGAKENLKPIQVTEVVDDSVTAEQLNFFKLNE